MAAMRLSSSASRSRKAAVAPERLGVGDVLGIGGEDVGRALRAAPRAMAASASSFCADGASARTCAAARARAPISAIRAATSGGNGIGPAGVDGGDLGEAHGPVSVQRP